MTQRTTSRLNHVGPLLALVVFTLFPYGWLAELWPWADQIATFLFATEAAHAVGHALIFACVGAAMLAVFPALRRQPWRYLALILVVAVAQEGFQLLYKGRGVVLNDLTDIGTDLVAAGVVFALVRASLAQRKGTVGGTADPPAAG